MPLRNFSALSEALQSVGEETGQAAPLPPTAGHNTAGNNAEKPPGEKDISPAVDEGAEALVSLSRTPSFHATTNKRSVPTTNQQPPPIASSENFHASDPESDLESLVAARVRSEISKLLPSLTASIQAQIAGQLPTLISSSTAPIHAELALLHTKARDCANGMIVLKNDLKTIYMTAVRDDDILAKKLEGVQRMTEGLMGAVEGMRREIAGVKGVNGNGHGQFVPPIIPPPSANNNHATPRPASRANTNGNGTGRITASSARSRSRSLSTSHDRYPPQHALQTTQAPFQTTQHLLQPTITHPGPEYPQILRNGTAGHLGGGMS